MPTAVVMPQMGESIAEGTIVRWIKKEGDAVERDEPLFEISTDKVDAEIPAPIAGVLTEIRVQEGETVSVNSVVAIIKPADTAAVSPAGPTKRAEAPSPEVPPCSTAAPATTTEPSRTHDAPRGNEAGPKSGAAAATEDEIRRQRSSPLVRRIARDHDVDVQTIAGSGAAGRVTKQDILQHLGLAEAGEPVKSGSSAPASATAGPAFRPGENVEIVPMSAMRRKIAERMLLSRQTSAHVHSVFEVDFTRVAQLREARKAEYEREGARLTYLSFIARAVIDSLRAVPIVNASVDGDNVVYKHDINLGIAVALDWGLIVPVIKGAHDKNMLGLSKAIAEAADRARTKRLTPDAVHDGTFTITNPGVFGALFGMPIINQPQVAILGVGAIEKRPVVIDDAVLIRRMGYLTLGYDHRVIDGAVADQFMSHLKNRLENFDGE
jgi:pyruvate dehydrogenase E2 component (dihydrolipoyllysine-residue acetyltransferase)